MNPLIKGYLGPSNLNSNQMLSKNLVCNLSDKLIVFTQKRKGNSNSYHVNRLAELRNRILSNHRSKKIHSEGDRESKEDPEKFKKDARLLMMLGHTPNESIQSIKSRLPSFKY